jgi:hypothetical protein
VSDQPSEMGASCGGFGSVVHGRAVTPPCTARTEGRRVATAPGQDVADALTVGGRTRLTSTFRVNHDPVARRATHGQPWLTEHGVLASLVFRHVRATTESTTHADHAERAALRPASRGAAAAKPRPGASSERPGSRHASGGSDSLAEIFLARWAELACRHLHALATKERRRDDRQDPTDAL